MKNKKENLKPSASEGSEGLGGASPGASEADLALAGVKLAVRVVRYFGNGPIDPHLECDIELRQMARDLLTEAKKPS
jgi:hypothetical protein